MIILRVQWLFLDLAHGTVGRVVQTNAFEAMLRALLMLMLMLSKLLMLGAQKNLRIFCTPSVI